MGLSAVVPTCNEEEWLPRLLTTLRQLPSLDEIVVADNASSDRTVEIAHAFGCRVVAGGLPGAGRNRGAAAARADMLLFVDADVVPTRPALDVVVSHCAGGPAAVTHFRHVPITDDRFVRGCYAVADRWFAGLARLGVHHGLASFLLVSRATFEAVGGFDELLDPGEDVDFVRRASRVGPVRHVRRQPVLVSERRFSTEPPVAFAAKTVLWETLRLAGSRSNRPRYRWGPHAAADAAREAAWLHRRGSDLG